METNENIPAEQTSPSERKPSHHTPLKVHKTTGEKWFDVVRFATGEGMILGVTAALAYASKYGKDSYLGIPNVLKSSEAYIARKLMPADKDNIFKVRLASAVASATVLMHGGNLFVPVMKGLQDRRNTIVAYFNKHFGKPGEVEEGNDRLRHETPESWGDVIKGRLVSWGVVSASFFGADMLAGKNKDGMRTFDKYEAQFGKWVAGMTDRGKEVIAAFPKDAPMTQEFAQALEKDSKAFRFGKILALDIYATTAALAIWSTVSKFSAILRSRRGVVAEEAGADAIAHGDPIAKDFIKTTQAETSPSFPDMTHPKKASHTARLTGRPADYRALADRAPSGAGITLS